MAYLRYFFSNFVCMQEVCKEPYVHQYGKLNGIGNASYGGIIYNVFGCDSDADYGPSQSSAHPGSSDELNSLNG